MNMGMGMDMGMDMDNLARHYSKLDEIKASSYPVRVQAALCRSACRCSKLIEIKAPAIQQECKLLGCPYRIKVHHS